MFKDDVRCAKALQPKDIRSVDVDISGGVWSIERRYCLMIGGAPEACRISIPSSKLWRLAMVISPRTLGRERLASTAEEGYVHCGPSGTEHFVTMIHNGIEYGLMQAYAAAENVHFCTILGMCRTQWLVLLRSGFAPHPMP